MANAPNINPRLTELMFGDRPTDPMEILGWIIRGDLISFSYAFWKNDPRPLVIVTDSWPGDRIRGVNVNYLTFPEIRVLLQHCNSSGFSYRTFMNNYRVVDSFRSYLWGGIREIRKLDCKFIAKVMSMISPAYDPAEIEAIRQEIHEQVSRIINPPVPAPNEPPAPAPEGEI